MEDREGRFDKFDIKKQCRDRFSTFPEIFGRELKAVFEALIPASGYDAQRR